MKKSLFTAIAVIAFSGVTMANTVTNKEVKKENLEVLEDCCLLSAADVVDSWCNDYELTDVEAIELYQFSYALCRGDEYGDLISY